MMQPDIYRDSTSADLTMKNMQRGNTIIQQYNNTTIRQYNNTEVAIKRAIQIEFQMEEESYGNERAYR